MAAPKKTRKSPRAQVSLVARYRSPTAFEFVQEECFDLSLGGMFIRSPAPAPAGTLIKLECDVNSAGGGSAGGGSAGGSAGKIRGVARVVWLREHSSDNQPSGMGVKFVKLDPGAREMIAEVLEHLGTEPDDRDTAPPPARTSSPATARTSSPATARTSSPATAAGTQPFGQTPPAPPSQGEATARTSTASEPASHAAASTTTGLSPAEPATKPMANRLSPRPAAARSASPADDREDKITLVEMPVPAEVAAQIASAPSAPPGKVERSNARIAAGSRSTRSAEQDARDAATLPPSAADASSYSFVYGALALAATVTLFIVFSSQQRSGAPSTPALQPLTAAASQPATLGAAEAPAPSTATAPIVADEPAAKYVLDVATIPSGARVTAGDHVLIAPGQLDLGQLEEAVQLTAESDGFEPAVATIDRVGFMREDGAMRRRVELSLTERARAPEPAAEPTPAPTPAEPHSHPAHRPKTNPAAEVPVNPSPVVRVLPVADVVEPVAPVAVATPVAPAPVEAQAAQPAQAQAPLATPLQIAAACLTTGDNACVIRALEGKAKSARELELLIETYRATGETRKGEAAMQVYVDNYPSERRASNYRSVLTQQKGEPAAAP